MNRFPILIAAPLVFSCACTRPAAKDAETLVCADQEEVIVNSPRAQDGSQMQVRQTVCKVWMTPHGLLRVELAHPVISAPEREKAPIAPIPKRQLEL